MTRRKMFRRAASGAIVVGLVGVVAGCAKKEKPRTFSMSGYVVKLDRFTNVASIHGDKIEGWMDEMTMDYPVENRDEYRVLRKGEKITATVNVSSEGFWLTNVKEQK